MAVAHFTPDVKLQTKLFTMTVFWGVVGIAAAAAMGVPVGLSEAGTTGALIGLGIAVGVNLIWVVPLLLVIPPYYRSLRYEIHPDEVIVRAGIITRSVKHVPFRTVTNLKVSQGPFDRLFGLGTLHIQTAGMSGQRGAEESLIGLPNSRETYERVAQALRSFRGAMAPTQAGEEGAPEAEKTLAAVLQEIRAIRRAVEGRNRPRDGS